MTDYTDYDLSEDAMRDVLDATPRTVSSFFSAHAASFARDGDLLPAGTSLACAVEAAEEKRVRRETDTCRMSSERDRHPDIQS